MVWLSNRSDGPQPHTISLTFPKRTLVGQVSIYVDFKQDESYTPSKIAVRTGTNFSDLQDIHLEEMREPSGWIDIPLSFSPLSHDSNAFIFYLFFLQSSWRFDHSINRDIALYARTSCRSRSWPTTNMAKIPISDNSKYMRRDGNDFSVKKKLKIVCSVGSFIRSNSHPGLERDEAPFTAPGFRGHLIVRGHQLPCVQRPTVM